MSGNNSRMPLEPPMPLDYDPNDPNDYRRPFETPVTPPPPPEFAPQVAAASWTNMNNFDPALFEDSTASASPAGPVVEDVKKRGRDDEDEVMPRLKAKKLAEAVEKSRESLPVNRKRRGSILGVKKDSGTEDRPSMTAWQGDQDVNIDSTGARANPSPAQALASRPIARMKSRATANLQQGYGYQSYVDPLAWNNIGSGGAQYDQIGGQQQHPNIYGDEGYAYPDPNAGWNNTQYSDQYDMQQQQGDGAAYSGQPGDSYDVSGQQGQGFQPVMYTWADVQSFVAEKESNCLYQNEVDLTNLRRAAAENLRSQRVSDMEAWQEALDKKEEAFKDSHRQHMELLKSIPGLRKEIESTYETEAQKAIKGQNDAWKAEINQRNSKIQALQNQLDQIACTPLPQAQVIQLVDPRVANLEAQLAAYAKADRERSQGPTQAESTQKLAKDLKEALDLIHTLESEKTALEGRESESKNAAKTLTSIKEALLEELRVAKTVGEKLSGEKDASVKKVSALEMQIESMLTTEDEAADLLAKVQSLGKAKKEVLRLKKQFRRGQLKVASLQAEANKISALTKDLEKSKLSIAALELAASQQIGATLDKKAAPVLSLAPVVPVFTLAPVAPILSVAPVITLVSITPTIVDAPVVPTTEENDTPKWLKTMREQIRMKNHPLSHENKRLRRDYQSLDQQYRTSRDQIRSAKEEIIAISKTLSVATSDLETKNLEIEVKSIELGSAKKNTKRLAGALITIAIFFFFALLSLSNLGPNLAKPTFSWVGRQTRQTPLKTRDISYLKTIPIEAFTAPSTEHSFTTKWDVDPSADLRTTAEQIAINEAYDIYHTFMAEREAQHIERQMAFSDPKPSVSLRAPIQDVKPTHQPKPKSPPRTSHLPAENTQSGLRAFVLDIFQGVGAFVGLMTFLGLLVKFKQGCKALKQIWINDRRLEKEISARNRREAEMEQSEGYWNGNDFVRY